MDLGFCLESGGDFGYQPSSSILLQGFEKDLETAELQEGARVVNRRHSEGVGGIGRKIPPIARSPFMNHFLWPMISRLTPAGIYAHGNS